MKNYIQQLVELFGHNDYLPETRKRVQQWLADEEHADEKNEALHTLWQEASKREVPMGMRQSLQRMKENIGIQPFTSFRKNYQLLIWKVAVAVLLTVSSVSVYLLLEKKPMKDLLECHIPTAEIHELTLSDGTQVVLNSKSTLLYPEQFVGKTRSVYLIGEADFKVKPDKKHPFIVKVKDCQITALGTEFNVNSYPESEEVMATLLEGSVKVEFNNLTSNIILKPNEQLKYNKYTKEYNLLQPDMDDVMAWQRGEIVFGNMHLDDIFTSLERKYPYTFVYSLHSIKKKTYSFRFPKDATLKEIMEIISQVVGDISYVVRENKCYIITNQ